MSVYCRWSGVPVRECDARYCEQSCPQRTCSVYVCGECGGSYPSPDHVCSERKSVDMKEVPR